MLAHHPLCLTRARLLAAGMISTMLLSCGGGSGSPNNPVTPPDTPPTCADFLAQRRTAAVLFHKLEVKRAFQAKAAARSDVFVHIAMDFRVYAKSNGYIPCECFLSTGKCRFDNRPENMEYP